MDEGLSRAVQTIFKRLYDDGLIYRAERIINWCPRCLTALSDIEVEHSDDEGELVSIRYGDGDDAIVVATTRAETMLGDTAVAVHPDDERYQHLVGTEVELPLTGRRDPDRRRRARRPGVRHRRGQGDPGARPQRLRDRPAARPAEPHDHGRARRDHRARPVRGPGPVRGAARRSSPRCATEGRIVAEKRPYVHAVGHCSRCGTTVEPRLSLQWFVQDRARWRRPPATPCATAGSGSSRPELAKRYFDWVDNMHDWCISRQLWWGHRIPVWYGPDGEVVCVGPDEQPPTGDGWTQDEDVLDTWFSSALWPFSTLGWPDETPDLAKFYPTSVLVTGYDILFFWVARMMMFGLYAMDGVQPFDVVDAARHGP